MACKPEVAYTEDETRVTLNHKGYYTPYVITIAVMKCSCGWKDKTYNSPVHVRSLAEAHTRKTHPFL